MRMHGDNKYCHLFARRWFPCLSVYGAALVFMILCVFLLFVNIYELHLLQVDHVALHSVPQPPQGADSGHPKSPIVWVHGQKLEVGYMKHVFNVFERIGFTSGNSASDWDVLWSHDYPFKTLTAQLQNLKPHQRVNHFPGSGTLTNKVQMALTDLNFIPKAFIMPSQKQSFLEYIKGHPSKQWVQKNNNHRGITVLSVEELDLETTNSFVQEYLTDPFLIDKRKFDIGLYVTLTSVDPLRVYIYQGDWLIRFCSKDYHPFDRSDVEKYVVSDDYTPLWEIESLAKFYKDSGSTRKNALFCYLRGIGKDPDILSKNLEAAVRDVLYVKEKDIIRQTAHYSYQNFFEMVRFDFLIDKDLNVYLMEVNMSPNLSSGHFAENKLLYEQVVFSLLSLVGVASSVQTNKQLARGESDVVDMQVSDRDLRVYVDRCTSDVCSSCQNTVCRLCATCMNKQLESFLTTTYLEHVNRQTWRRVVPKPLELQTVARSWNPDTDVEFQKLTQSNKIMSTWFIGKCAEDSTWCS